MLGGGGLHHEPEVPLITRLALPRIAHVTPYQPPNGQTCIYGQSTSRAPLGRLDGRGPRLRSTLMNGAQLEAQGGGAVQ